jgi:UDP-N-acetylmuramate dehydrogenase
VKFIKQKERLDRYTTIKVGGIASFFAVPRTIEELIGCVKFAQDRDIPIYILGGGSNTVFGDVKGLVISMNALRTIETEATDNALEIYAQAGVPLKEIIALGIKYRAKDIYKLLHFNYV